MQSFLKCRAVTRPEKSLNSKPMLENCQTSSLNGKLVGQVSLNCGCEIWVCQFSEH